MGFGSPLELGDLHHCLPARAQAGISGIDRLAGYCRARKHRALGEVGIMGDGNEINPGLPVGFCQPFPKIFRVFTIIRAEREDLFRGIAVNRGQHNPVQVFAVRLCAVFPTDQRGELSRRIVPVCSIEEPFPVALEDHIDLHFMDCLKITCRKPHVTKTEIQHGHVRVIPGVTICKKPVIEQPQNANRAEVRSLFGRHLVQRHCHHVDQAGAQFITFPFHLEHALPKQGTGKPFVFL